MANSFDFIQQWPAIQKALDQAHGLGLDNIAFNTFVDVGDQDTIWKTLFSDGILTFESDYKCPFKHIAATIEPVQSGSGDPSPDNVRPITGWTGAEISHSGEDTSDPETLTINWQDSAGTVYGGTLDVVSGLLTVDRAEHTVSENDVAQLFQVGTNANRVGIKVSDSQLSPTNTERLKIISNIAKADTSVLTASTQKIGDCCMYSGGAMTYSVALFGVPTTATSSVDARSWLVEQGCTFVYYLATPQTYQLTPQQMTTLLGTNNIWVDTGGIAVTYKDANPLFLTDPLNVGVMTLK